MHVHIVGMNNPTIVSTEPSVCVMPSHLLTLVGSGDLRLDLIPSSSATVNHQLFSASVYSANVLTTWEFRLHYNCVSLYRRRLSVDRTKTRMHAHTNASARARTHTYTHTYTHTHTHAHTHTHTHAHTHARTHARTHAHTQSHATIVRLQQWQEQDYPVLYGFP